MRLAYFMTPLLLLGCTPVDTEQPMVSVVRCQAGSEYRRLEEVPVVSGTVRTQTVTMVSAIVEHCMMEQAVTCNPRYRGALRCGPESVRALGPSKLKRIYKSDVEAAHERL